MDPLPSSLMSFWAGFGSLWLVGLRLHFFVSCSPEAFFQILCHMGLSIEHFTTWSRLHYSEQERGRERTPARVLMRESAVFRTPIREVTSLCRILFIRSESPDPAHTKETPSYREAESVRKHVSSCLLHLKMQKGTEGT